MLGPVFRYIRALSPCILSFPVAFTRSVLPPWFFLLFKWHQRYSSGNTSSIFLFLFIASASALFSMGAINLLQFRQGLWWGYTQQARPLASHVHLSTFPQRWDRRAFPLRYRASVRFAPLWSFAVARSNAHVVENIWRTFHGPFDVSGTSISRSASAASMKQFLIALSC